VGSPRASWRRVVLLLLPVHAMRGPSCRTPPGVLPVPGSATRRAVLVLLLSRSTLTMPATGRAALLLLLRWCRRALCWGCCCCRCRRGAGIPSSWWCCRHRQLACRLSPLLLVVLVQVLVLVLHHA
jgi:hypothetical protein